MLGVQAGAEIARRGRVRRDHVPARSPPAEGVDGRELVGQRPWRIVGGRVAGREADALGRRGQSRDLDQRVQRIEAALPEHAAVAFADGQGVLEEHHVELAPLGELGDADVVIDAGQVDGIGLRVAPRGDVVSAGQKPQPEVDLAIHDLIATLLRARHREALGTTKPAAEIRPPPAQTSQYAKAIVPMTCRGGVYSRLVCAVP